MRGARWTGTGLVLAGAGTTLTAATTETGLALGATVMAAVGLALGGGTLAASPDRRGAKALLSGLALAALGGLIAMVGAPGIPGRGLLVAGAGLAAFTLARALGENAAPSIVFLRTGFGLASLGSLARLLDAPNDIGLALSAVGFALAALAVNDAAVAFTRTTEDSGAPELG